jgi:hypothetical protein
MFSHEKQPPVKDSQGRRLSYRFDGNEAFNAPRLLARRMQIKDDKTLIALSRQFWSLFESVKSSSKIIRQEGIHVLVLFMRALFEPEDFEYEEVVRSAESLLCFSACVIFSPPLKTRLCKSLLTTGTKRNHEFLKTKTHS